LVNIAVHQIIITERSDCIYFSKPFHIFHFSLNIIVQRPVKH